MEICLFNLRQAAILVLDEAGPEYFNRAGGAALREPRARGFLVPICDDPPPGQAQVGLPQRLGAATRNRVGIGAPEARQLNALLREISSSDLYEVDGTRLDQSMEGWIFVEVYPQGPFSQYGAGPAFKAVLTWPNGA
ncbi:MAG: hypothetical protein JNJ44_11780 [Zoogloeaceae bacterium]|nr:hypothetical protein [Zoogloeaceae bacterium]